MNRNITGTIRKTDGTVWAGAVVEFELERSSFDEEAQYPGKPVRAVAGQDGEISLSLWVNQEAPRPARYICTLPDGSQFRFTLPSGFGAVDLSTLRETAVEDDSPSQSDLIAFLPVLRSEARQVVETELVDVLADVNAEIATKADQTALDSVVGDVGDLTTALAAKADQTALDSVVSDVSDLTTTVGTKADQTALDSVVSDVSDLTTTVGTKADQTALDSVVGDVGDLTTALGTKADQADLDTTNSNLQNVSNDLADLSDTVDTKAAQSALDGAIADLQDAISLAQSTLVDLINQKAPLDHTHAPGDVQDGTNHGVAFFDGDGNLDSSPDLIYSNGNLGLGTDSPAYALDLRHPEAEEGFKGRMVAALNSSSPFIQLSADNTAPGQVSILMESGEMYTAIRYDPDGRMVIGSSRTSPIEFYQGNGSTYYCGFFEGDAPTTTEFPQPGSFGFYKDTHGRLMLVFNDFDIQTLEFSGGFGVL